MQITPLDLARFIGFFVVVVSFSLWKSRGTITHSADTSAFFLAGVALFFITFW